MATRICTICGKEYSSGASYRVHKSRYHRANSVTDDEIKLEETLEATVSSNPSSPAPKSREVESRGGNMDVLLIAGGVVAVILAILLGGRK